ncbi:hypothetical protein ACFQ9X_31035 [Catenulispora yoronensis]
MQERLAEQRPAVGVGAGVAGADGPVELHGLVPLHGVVVPQIPPASVGGVRAANTGTLRDGGEPVLIEVCLGVGAGESELQQRELVDRVLDAGVLGPVELI